MRTLSRQHDVGIVRGFEIFARIAGAIIVGVAIGAIVGWASGIRVLTEVVPGQPSMKANAAISFILVGCSLVLGGFDHSIARRAGFVLSLSAMAIGAATLVEYVAGRDLGIDHLFNDPASARQGRAPGRMAELAATGFVLVGGLGMLGMLRRLQWLREALAIGTIGIAMTGMASYGFAMAGQGGELFTHMPIHTSVLLLLAALGWMSSFPMLGLTRIATAASFGGAFARRLLLPALLLPVAYAFAFKGLQARLGVSETVAYTLAAVFTGGTVSSLVLWVSELLDRVERQGRAFQILRNDASTDALTGLLNRGAFDVALSGLVCRQREEGRTFALLLLDLDRFKGYNDSFGHPAGDEVLRLVGNILRTVLRPLDIAARYGGEEFGVLLSDTDEDMALRVANRIIEAFHAHAWPLRPMTVSIGVAEARSGEEPHHLVRRADAALYRGKSAGRDCVAIVEPPGSTRLCRVGIDGALGGPTGAAPADERRASVALVRTSGADDASPSSGWTLHSPSAAVDPSL